MVTKTNEKRRVSFCQTLIACLYCFACNNCMVAVSFHQFECCADFRMKCELAFYFTCLVALFSRNRFSLCVRTRAGRLRSASGSRLSPLGCAADCLLLFALPLRRSFQIRCQLQHVSCGHCILGWGHQDPIRAFLRPFHKRSGRRPQQTGDTRPPHAVHPVSQK